VLQRRMRGRTVPAASPMMRRRGYRCCSHSALTRPRLSSAMRITFCSWCKTLHLQNARVPGNACRRCSSSVCGPSCARLCVRSRCQLTAEVKTGKQLYMVPTPSYTATPRLSDAEDTAATKAAINEQTNLPILSQNVVIQTPSPSAFARLTLSAWPLRRREARLQPSSRASPPRPLSSPGCSPPRHEPLQSPPSPPATCAIQAAPVEIGVWQAVSRLAHVHEPCACVVLQLIHCETPANSSVPWPFSGVPSEQHVP